MRPFHTSHHKAFTLPELLVATTIFMVIMGMVTSLYSSLTNNTDKILGTIDLYQKANSVNRLLRDDFSQSLSSCAFNIYTKGSPSFTAGDNEHLTFMRSMTRVYTAGSNDLDNSSPIYSNYDISWIRWEWDNQGRLWRAQTHRAHHQDRNNGRSNPVVSNNPGGMGFYSYPEEWGRWATPAREYKHFEPVVADAFQLYDLGVINTFTNGTPRIDYPLRPEINIHHANNSRSEYPADGQRMQRGIWALHNGTDQTSSTGLSGNPIPDAYAGMNADGLSFNKNAINLIGLPVGHSHYNDYPSQLHLIDHGFEYPTIELIKADGSLISNSDNSTSGSDNGNVPGICLDGNDVHGRNANGLPQYIRFNALIHMGTYIDADYDDIDRDGDSDEYAIDALHDLLANESAADHADLDRDKDTSETWLTATRDRSGSSNTGAATPEEKRLAMSYYFSRERVAFILYQTTVKLAY